MAGTRGSLAGALREQSASLEIFFMFGLEVFQPETQMKALQMFYYRSVHVCTFGGDGCGRRGGEATAKQLNSTPILTCSIS